MDNGELQEENYIVTENLWLSQEADCPTTLAGLDIDLWSSHWPLSLLTSGGEQPSSCCPDPGVKLPNADPSTMETLCTAKPRKVFTFPVRVTATQAYVGLSMLGNQSCQ